MPQASGPVSSPNSLAERGQIAAVLVILLAGTYFRAREIARYSLWLDEAWVGLTSHTRTVSDFLLGLSTTPMAFAILVDRKSHPRYLRASIPIATSSLAFFLFARRYVNSALVSYWQGAFLPRQPVEAVSAAFDRIWLLMSHLYRDEPTYLMAGFSRYARVETDLRETHAFLESCIPDTLTLSPPGPAASNRRLGRDEHPTVHEQIGSGDVARVVRGEE